MLRRRIRTTKIGLGQVIDAVNTTAGDQVLIMSAARLCSAGGPVVAELDLAWREAWNPRAGEKLSCGAIWLAAVPLYSRCESLPSWLLGKIISPRRWRRVAQWQSLRGPGRPSAPSKG